GQKKVAEEPRSYHHLALFWGFLILQIGLVDMMVTGLFGQYGITFATFITAPGHAAVLTFVDLGNAVVALALLYAFFRRLVIKPSFVPANLDAMLILSGISMIVFTHFGHRMFDMAHQARMEDGSIVSYALGLAFGLFSGPGVAEALPGGVAQT